MYYSYVMGVDESILELKNQGFQIENDGENYKIAFPKDKASVWEEFITKRLQVGYWNEYLAGNRVVFLFQLEQGIKRYEVYDFKNKEVLDLCEKFSGQRMDSLYLMLSKNHYYSSVLEDKKEKLRCRSIIICASIVVIFVGIFAGIMCKTYLDKKELERKEETVVQMIDLAEKVVETLNDNDYEAYMNLFTEDRKDYIEDLDAMYSFLEDDRYGYGYEDDINYEDFSFEVVEVYDVFLGSFFDDDDSTIEEMLHYGLDIRVEFGNSEKTFRQLWCFKYTIEDGKIKIHGGISRDTISLELVDEEESE